MRLRVEQLSRAIDRQGLLPIYYVTGDEPFQVNESTDTVRSKARKLGIEERVVWEVGTGFDWQILLDENNALSLFSGRRLLELRLGAHKPGAAGGKVLSTYVDHVTDGNVLLISGARIDKKGQQAGWFKALDRVGAIVQIWQIDAGKLPDWIIGRVRQSNKQIEPKAADLIADHVEGNLLAADQEIKKLCLLVEHDLITVDDVVEFISDCARFDAFALIECAYAGNTVRVVRLLDSLRGEGVDVMAVYGPMAWSFRQLCYIAYGYHQGQTLNSLFPRYKVFSAQQKSAMQVMLKRYPINKLHDFLHHVNALDTLIKSADKVLAWEALLALLLAFAGHRVPFYERGNGGR